MKIEPINLPSLQDENDHRREVQREAKRRYRARKRFAAYAPELGLNKVTVFADVDSFKRYVTRYVKTRRISVDMDLAMREIDRIYADWKGPQLRQ